MKRLKKEPAQSECYERIWTLELNKSEVKTSDGPIYRRPFKKIRNYKTLSRVMAL